MQHGNPALQPSSSPWWRRRLRPRPGDIAYDLWQLLAA